LDGTEKSSPELIRPEIVLIGPIRAGKSTLGRLLAEALGVPQVSMDEHCWRYYEEIGIGRGSADANGPDGMLASRYNVHAVERLLTGFRDCVFDLGAGHSVYRDDQSLEQVRRALAPLPNVVLILPSPDLDRCSAVLCGRNTENDWLNGFKEEQGYDPNEHFLRHRSNFELAKRVVYTEGKSPEETRDEILGAMEPR
jgi:hypothetical protein